MRIYKEFIKRHGVSILIAGGIAVFITLAWFLISTPLYYANARLYSKDVEVLRRTSEILKSDEFLARVAERLHKQPSVFEDSYQIVYDSAVATIAVEGKADDPKQAALIANTIVDEIFDSYRDFNIGGVNAQRTQYELRLLEAQERYSKLLNDKNERIKDFVLDSSFDELIKKIVRIRVLNAAREKILLEATSTVSVGYAPLVYAFEADARVVNAYKDSLDHLIAAQASVKQNPVDRYIYQTLLGAYIGNLLDAKFSIELYTNLIDELKIQESKTIPDLYIVGRAVPPVEPVSAPPFGIFIVSFLLVSAVISIVPRFHNSFRKSFDTRSF